MNKIDRIKELTELLNKASDSYYNTGDTIMEDHEFDTLLEELRSLEQETLLNLSTLFLKKQWMYKDLAPQP